GDFVQSIPLSDGLFQGQISLEHGDGWVKPWRVPFEDRALFPPDAINRRSEQAAGVRLRFASETKGVTLTFLPYKEDARFACVSDGEVVGVADVSEGEEQVTFTDLAGAG